ncbi:MAG: hypothetical protein K0S08_2184 [Gammaproteobacteria bacterium]|nr:hypothetical protein [Gammaproteobacteria bacterium]
MKRTNHYENLNQDIHSVTVEKVSPSREGEATNEATRLIPAKPHNALSVVHAPGCCTVRVRSLVKAGVSAGFAAASITFYVESTVLATLLQKICAIGVNFQINTLAGISTLDYMTDIVVDIRGTQGERRRLWQLLKILYGTGVVTVGAVAASAQMIASINQLKPADPLWWRIFAPGMTEIGGVFLNIMAVPQIAQIVRDSYWNAYRLYAKTRGNAEAKKLVRQVNNLEKLLERFERADLNSPLLEDITFLERFSSDQRPAEALKLIMQLAANAPKPRWDSSDWGWVPWLLTRSVERSVNAAAAFLLFISNMGLFCSSQIGLINAGISREGSLGFSIFSNLFQSVLSIEGGRFISQEVMDGLANIVRYGSLSNQTKLGGVPGVVSNFLIYGWAAFWASRSDFTSRKLYGYCGPGQGSDFPTLPLPPAVSEDIIGGTTVSFNGVYAVKAMMSAKMMAIASFGGQKNQNFLILLNQFNQFIDRIKLMPAAQAQALFQTLGSGFLDVLAAENGREFNNALAQIKGFESPAVGAADLPPGQTPEIGTGPQIVVEKIEPKEEAYPHRSRCVLL